MRFSCSVADMNGTTCLPSAVALLLVLSPFHAVAGSTQKKGAVGTPAAKFKLDRLTGGQVSSDAYRGKPAVLIVARKLQAAPHCKAWTLQLTERFGRKSHIYNLIVTNNPWYIPKAVVRSKLSDFVPKSHHHLILIDWGIKIEKEYGIVGDGIPTLFVVDGKGKIALRYKGAYNKKAYDQIVKCYTDHEGPQDKHAK